jgi:antibiotic biosynthesis monooxygenase (ABM) superfamily enzyme
VVADILARMSEPVTVSITRIVDPAHEEQMLAWLRAGADLAGRSDGFLGCGWVRPVENSTEWHVLYRFSGSAALHAWETSERRAWWLGAAQGLVGESHVERRTGIEGWFDEPSSADVQDLRPPAPSPPRWKQMCVIFLVFFPLSLAANYAGAAWLGDVALPLRVLISVCLMTPIMTYLALPWVTRTFAPWLNATRKRPAPGYGA